MAQVKVKDLATQINAYMLNIEYFWACGLIKDTNQLWKNPENLKLLTPSAQVIAKHYLS